MKRLTVNQVSAASLRANRKTYLSLAVGILLAVFLATAVTVCAYGVVQAKERDVIRRVGIADCFLLDEPEVTDEALRQSGLFSRIGRVFVTASVADSGIYLGYSDEAGQEILLRGCVEGRMPEAAGEIAVEQSALAKMRLDPEPGLGDTVTWAIQPIDGVPEERSFTIVGILREQSMYMDGSAATTYWTSRFDLAHWPAVVVSPQEPAFATGRTAVHRVMTYAPLVSFSMVERHHSLENADLLSISRTEGAVYSSDPRAVDAENILEQTILILILGLSLLLSTCIAISSAMESVLAAKTEEIGMLRAVGATRRQIRHIFGRDAWLLSLVALPLGLALGCLTAWLFSLIAPQEMLFAVRLWLLLPVLGISALCIFLSSALPLRRASRQMPMGVLRDTALLRRAKGFHSRKEFRATTLIALRQLRLFPLRQLGAALMAALTLFCSAFLGELLYGAEEELRLPDYDFVLYPGLHSLSDMRYSFARSRPEYSLSEQDMGQLRAIPRVERVTQSAYTMANLLLDGEIPNYFRTFHVEDFGDHKEYFDVSSWGGSYGLDWLLMDESAVQPPDAVYGEPGMKDVEDYRMYKQMTAAAEAQGIDAKLFPIMIQTEDVANAGLGADVLAGKLDLAALDAGEEVLVMAPTFCVWKSNRNNNYNYACSPKYDELEEFGFTILAEVENDYFYPGQTLELMQLVNAGEPPEFSNFDTWVSDYAAMERHDVTVRVGALIDGEARLGSGAVTIITTEKGARALGIEMTNVTTIDVYLDGDVDAETEQNIETRLGQIAMRGNMQVSNRLEYARQLRRQETMVLLLFGGMTLLFFAVSVAMQVMGAGRRIRSDSRMIGTLRAVGADEQAILGCYRLPMLVTTALGTVIAILLYLLFVVTNHSWDIAHPATLIPAIVVMGVLCALCCLVGVRGRLRQVMKVSIVENIREL